MALSVWAQASATPALFVLVHTCAIKLRSFAQRFAWALFLGSGPSPVADVIERPFSGTCLEYPHAIDTRDGRRGLGFPLCHHEQRKGG